MNPRRLSRRDLLKGVSSGFGYLAFAGLSSMAAGAGSKDSPLAPKAPHFPARAKRVIFLCMNGAPSHVDTFDYKPELSSADGKASDRPGRIPGAKLMGSPWKFQPARRERALGLGAVPRGRRARRRAVRHPQHAHRPAGPPGGVPDAAHRQLAVHPALARGVDALRPRDRERRPARVHLGEADRAQWRRAELRQRVPPGGLPGDPHRQRGPADRQAHGSATSRTRGSTPRPSAFSSTSSSR